MPLINGHEYSPDEALAAHYCPECGADFSKVNAHGHRRTHWVKPPPADPQHDESRRRIALYDGYLKGNPPLASSERPPLVADTPAAPASDTQEVKQ